MTNVERDLLPMMTESSQRLTRLIELNAPSAVICQEIAILFKRATIIWGDQMGKSFGEFLANDLRAVKQRCIKCGVQLAAGSDYCPACDTKMATYLECGLTETDLAEITSKRFDTRDEATLWANDLNNNDLEDDWNAAVVRIGRKFTITIKNA